MSEETYEMKSFTNVASFTVGDMRKQMRELEWLRYEVDPSWARFCSFGPEDIGSVWEKIGAIRKRPRFDAIMIGDSMLKALNKQIEADFFNGSFAPSYGSCVAEVDAKLFGLQVVRSPLLSNRAVLINSRGV